MGVFNSRSNANSTILLSKTGRMEGKGGGIRTRTGLEKRRDRVFKLVYINIKQCAHVYGYLQLESLHHKILNKNFSVSNRACGVYGKM